MVNTPWSENFPFQGIKLPRGGSFGVENGLNNLSWETWVYELGPLRSQAHRFHSSGWGWNIEPLAWARRSLMTGSSRGGPSRRDIISGNHTLLGHRGAMRSSRTRFRRTLSRTSGSREIGGNAYRQSLELDAWARTRVNSEMSLKTQTDPLVPGRSPSISAPPPRGGASIPRALAPVSTGCRMSAPILWAPRMQAAWRDNNFPWDHRRIWHTSLQSGHDRKPMSPLFRWGSTKSHALLRCLGLLPLSSPRYMSKAGEEFLECSCLFSWFLKSLDNWFSCIAEEVRGKIGASIRKFLSFLLMLLRFNHKCLSVATRCCHSPERQICGPIQPGRLATDRLCVNTLLPDQPLLFPPGLI